MTTEASQMRALSQVRAVAIFLLLLNGAGALYGGSSLMFHPDGSGLRLSLSLLKHAPFRDFMIPGFVLFIVNGLFSVTALLLTATHYRGYDRYVVAQGILLMCWLGIQILLIRTLDVMHLVMAATGAGLILCGQVIRRLNTSLEQC